MKNNYFIIFMFLLMNSVVFSQDNNAIVSKYLKDNQNEIGLSDEEIKDWIVTDQTTSKKSKVTHVYIRQQYQGIEIYNAVANFNILEKRILSFGNRLEKNIASRVNTTHPQITPFQAIENAADQLGLNKVDDLKIITAESSKKFVFNTAGVSLENIPVKLMFQPIENGGINLVWDLSIYTLDQQHWWSVRVDALSGKIIDKTDWVVSCNFGTCEHLNHNKKAKQFSQIKDEKAVNYNSLLIPPTTDQYRVFPIPIESPNHGSDVLVVGPYDAVASPFGWHDTNGVAGAEYTITRGNNVYAQEDANGNNGFGSAPSGGASLNFDFPMNLNQAPAGYQNAAITNLFYMNNIMHDVWYQYGFDDASGNFQTNNYGRGGAGNDAVIADAQDGSGLNNANFGTPADGGAPRMQMFLWSAPTSSPIDKLTINTPAGISGGYNAIPAGFGAPVPTSPLTSDLVLVIDNTAPTDDGCEVITNAAALNGKIAVIRRGTCSFVIKVKAAQNAGAVAVIMINNAAGSPIVMGGADATITIPSVMISDIDGNTILTQMLSQTVNATLLDVPPSGFQLDGDLDNGIIAHEYGHGVSNRLTGGPAAAGCLGNAEQMGEGWSDWLALMLTIEPGDQATDSRGIGTYAIGESTSGGGIRPAPYTTNFAINNFTYASTNNTGAISQPHGIGFVWCTMLWDMTWAMIDKYGFDSDVYNGTGGNNMAMHLVIEGMKLQPCSPGFQDGRDAILAADVALYGGANQCLIWNAFAARGLGFSARQNSSNNRTDQVEAFDIPAYLLLPEINVKGNNFDIVDGDSTPVLTDDSDFGVVASASETKTFTIYNENCQTALNVSSISLSGINSTDFSIANISLPYIVPTDGSVTFDVVFNPQSLGVKNATIVINNDDANESVYDFAVRAEFLCGTETSSWDGSVWSNGVPSKITAVTFTGNYSSSSDLEACSVTITNNAQVTINSGDTFIVDGDVTVVAGSSLTVENNAALRQIDNAAVNTGSIIVKRNATVMNRLDYTAWSTPVVGQQLQAFSPNTVSTRFYEYLFTGVDTPTAYQSVAATTNFVAGKGYMIRADNTYTGPTVFNGQFTGVPINGIVNQSVGLGYNVLGNPYPSPIDANTFLTDNTNIGALYFWTNTTAASGGIYPQNNFATYTSGAGGVAAFASGKVPNGTIQTGQGFYVQATSAGSASFNNLQREDASVSTQFYRNASTSSLERHRIWLNLNDSNTSYNQILVGYIEGASNGVDFGIDAKVLDTSKPMLYNIVNNEEYVIQGKSLPFNDEDIVPLGLKALTAGAYTISIENVDGLFDNQDVFIKDKLNNIIHDLKSSAYSFTAQEGTFNNRFEIVYKSGSLSSDEFTNANTMNVFVNSNEIHVNSSKENINEIIVFDVLGRKLYENKTINANTFTISTLKASNQALIVKVKLQNGQVKTEKIIL
ncbi:T9SS-dependent M36 family metallopeptidase [Flavobacterium sp.]|uniref:T9SS-dependent M36 family metallopeptidase n=1 Tax=Flavobacterium sp. TaxID=239 RepID=UPI003D2E6728